MSAPSSAPSSPIYVPEPCGHPMYDPKPTMYDPKTTPAYDPFETEQVTATDRSCISTAEITEMPAEMPAFNLPAPAHENPKAVQNRCTALCTSYLEGRTCMRGEKCTFAHSPDDLVIAECRYDDRCNKIVWDAGFACNRKFFGKKECEPLCNRIHRGETRENFYIRCGIVRVEPRPTLPMPLSKPIIKPIIKPAVTKTSELKITKSTDDGVILEVSKDLVLSAVKMLIETGVAKIDVRIV